MRQGNGRERTLRTPVSFLDPFKYEIYSSEMDVLHGYSKGYSRGTQAVCVTLPEFWLETSELSSCIKNPASFLLFLQAKIGLPKKRRGT